jgi:hypothetical protein
VTIHTVNLMRKIVRPGIMNLPEHYIDETKMPSRDREEAPATLLMISIFTTLPAGRGSAW